MIKKIKMKILSFLWDGIPPSDVVEHLDIKTSDIIDIYQDKAKEIGDIYYKSIEKDVYANLSCRIDEAVNGFMADHINNYSLDELFIDEVIDRINRKQLK